jgi:hypothetical protein
MTFSGGGPRYQKNERRGGSVEYRKVVGGPQHRKVLEDYLHTRHFKNLNSHLTLHSLKHEKASLNKLQAY